LVAGARGGVSPCLQRKGTLSEKILKGQCDEKVKEFLGFLPDYREKENIL
jgi:hypothetical protein